MRGIIEFGHLRLPKEVTSIQIIDGQHRLYGYSKLPRSEHHIVHVLAYKAEGKSLATLFVDINSKQTKVSASLLWELYPDIYGEDDPEFSKAEISLAVEGAAEKELKGLVEYISAATRGNISFHTLCSEVQRANLLLDFKDSRKLQNCLEALFGAMNELGAEFQNVNERFLFTNNALSAIIRTAGRIVKFEYAANRPDNLKSKPALQETFRGYLKPVYQHFFEQVERLKVLRRRSGNSGINETEDEITDAIRSRYKNAFPYRSKKVPQDWEQAIDECAALISSINSRASDNGRSLGWILRTLIRSALKRCLVDPSTVRTLLEFYSHNCTKIFMRAAGRTGQKIALNNFCPSILYPSLIRSANSMHCELIGNIKPRK